MQPWEDALEKRAELEAWWRSPKGAEFAENWARAESATTGKMFAAPTIHMVEAAKLATATPVFVAPDMFELWQHALPDFPSETLEESDLSIPSGFVLLPKGWPCRDIKGDIYKIRAFAWTRAKIKDEFGVHISFYIDPSDDPDPAELQQWTYGGAPLHFLHGTGIQFGQNYTRPELWASALGTDISDEAVGDAVRTVQGAQAFWRLGWQRIGKPYALEASRATRKRFSRRWKDRPIPLVTVIALRPYREGGQKPHEDGSKEQIEWTHRWIVGGHWRQQPYPSLGITRSIYIAPYVKGREDLPLVLKDKAYGWVR